MQVAIARSGLPCLCRPSRARHRLRCCALPKACVAGPGGRSDGPQGAASKLKSFSLQDERKAATTCAERPTPSALLAARAALAVFVLASRGPAIQLTFGPQHRRWIYYRSVGCIVVMACLKTNRRACMVAVTAHFDIVAKEFPALVGSCCVGQLWMGDVRPDGCWCGQSLRLLGYTSHQCSVRRPWRATFSASAMVWRHCCGLAILAQDVSS